MSYAYHIISNSFVGNTIYPLNQLKKIYPEIAAKENQKYNGREEITKSIVYSPQIHKSFNWGNEILNWGDVSFFTLHNPALVFLTFVNLKIPIKKKWRIAKIPLENFSERKMVWTHIKNFNSVLPPEDCLSVKEYFRLDDLKSLPEKAKDYYVEKYFQEGKQPLLYSYIPHLLTPDSVSFSENDILEIELD